MKGLENTKIKREQLKQISVIVNSIVVIAITTIEFTITEICFSCSLFILVFSKPFKSSWLSRFFIFSFSISSKTFGTVWLGDVLAAFKFLEKLKSAQKKKKKGVGINF